MLDPREYVVGTFEPCDLEGRVEPAVLDYIKENGLVDSVVLDMVDALRGWYDDVSGDVVDDFLVGSLCNVVGDDKLWELEELES